MSKVHGNTRHGMASPPKPEYTAWKHMKSRCYNPRDKKYASYGGRGIGVCNYWLESFENFYSDMGKRPGLGYSIDRIDNDAGYGPGNCRWATRKQQQENKRPIEYCKWGHPMADAYVFAGGVRACRICKIRRTREWRKAHPSL